MLIGHNKAEMDNSNFELGVNRKRLGQKDRLKRVINSRNIGAYKSFLSPSSTKLILKKGGKKGSNNKSFTFINSRNMAQRTLENMNSNRSDIIHNDTIPSKFKNSQAHSLGKLKELEICPLKELSEGRELMDSIIGYSARSENQIICSGKNILAELRREGEILAKEEEANNKINGKKRSRSRGRSSISSSRFISSPLLSRKSTFMDTDLNKRFHLDQMGGARCYLANSGRRILKIGPHLVTQIQLMLRILGLNDTIDQELSDKIKHDWVLNLDKTERMKFTKAPMHLKTLSNVQILKSINQYYGIGNKRRLHPGEEAVVLKAIQNLLLEIMTKPELISYSKDRIVLRVLHDTKLGNLYQFPIVVDQISILWKLCLTRYMKLADFPFNKKHLECLHSAMQKGLILTYDNMLKMPTVKEKANGYEYIEPIQVQLPKFY